MAAVPYDEPPLAAAVLPALRTARIDPVESIRAD